MRVNKITPAIGARIQDLALAQLDEASAADLRGLLAERKVLVFPDQRLDGEQYVRFCRRFGEPSREDLQAGSDRPPEVGAIHISAGQRQTINFWHMDHSFRETPSAYICLYARQLPPCGGDTLFASLEAAYEGLDEDTRTRIVGLHAEHGYTQTQNSARRYSAAEIARRSSAAPVRHPLACLNRETGRPYLFVNTPVYCRRIVELDAAEGDPLLRDLYLHVQRPEFHFRLTWTTGMIVLWENAHCLHYPVADYFPHERLLWRVLIPGTAGPPAAFDPGARMNAWRNG
ncbi:MAG: TauD/TfdA family dioxygenase [Gammaproteobacteria bacterium]|nr:TauD/TfdA family dioxygenase [Gammaproteobacteria bacterium]